MHSRRVVLLCRYTVVSNVISRFVVSQKLICQNESLIVSRCFMADKSLYGVISKFTFVIFLTVNWSKWINMFVYFNRSSDRMCKCEYSVTCTLLRYSSCIWVMLLWYFGCFFAFIWISVVWVSDVHCSPSKMSYDSGTATEQIVRLTRLYWVVCCSKNVRETNCVRKQCSSFINLHILVT